MRAKISKWGNSLGVRLPKAIAEAAGLREGQVVDLAPQPDGVNLRRTEEEPRYSLNELVAEMERLGPEKRPGFEEWGILPSEWPAEDWSDVAPPLKPVGTKNASNQRKRARRR
jgi:antitoxin MazE